MSRNGRKVILTTDLSEVSWHALPTATELAERFDARLLVLSIVQDSSRVAFAAPPGAPAIVPDSERLQQDLEKATRQTIEERMRAEGDRQPFDVAIMKGGNISDAIIEEADRRNACFIVMATHGRHGLSHMLVGSTTERVVRDSPVPVVTIRVANN